MADVAVESSALARSVGVASSLTFSFTVTSATVLAVGTSIRAATDANRPVTAISYAGVALTKVREDQVDADDIGTGMWWLGNPATGANNVVIVCTGDVNDGALVGIPVGLLNADTTNPVDAQNGANGAGVSDVSVNVTTVAAGSLILDVVFCKDDTGITVSGAGHTQLQNNIGGVGTDVSAMGSLSKPTPGLGVPTWTGVASAEPWVVSAVAFKPSQGVIPSTGAYAQESSTNDRYQLEDASGVYLIEPWPPAGGGFVPSRVWGDLDGLGRWGFKDRLNG